jgi:predicted O-linked N-acetylglucosamine transferase (SPINDLY family)
MTQPETQQVPISEAMRLAIDHHQAGRLPEADLIYRAVLESEPSHAGAKYNRALIALQSGRPREAVPVLGEALQSDPDNASHWMNYAVALAGSGEPQAARQVLLQARERGLGGQALAGLLAQVERMMQSQRPTVIETVGASGESALRAPNVSALLDLYQQGRYAEAEAQARELWAQFPESAMAAQVLGASLLEQAKFEEAREVLARASDALPGDAQVQYLLGLALRRLGRNQEARWAFEQGLASAPDDLPTLLNASANAVTLGDAAEARRYAERAIALQPDSVDTLRVLADAAVAGRSFEEAIGLYRRAMALDPAAADLYVNLGDALTATGRPQEAVGVLERAVALRPSDPQAHLNLGTALFQLGETVSAREQYRAASDLAPNRPDAHTAYLFCLLHDDTVSPEQCFHEHLRIGELIEAPRRHLQRPHANDRDPDRGLRVGFVSGDLRDHAVAYLVEPTWQAMRGGRHQVIAYANQRVEDTVSARLRALTDAWIRVERLTDEELAERIRQDRIDILFDLSGHTTDNRLPVFAMKPAPVQVSFIGYPYSTGLPSMDYAMLFSAENSGRDLDRSFCEKLVRMRNRCFQPEWGAPAVGRLPALDAGFVTFGSFNRPSKIGEVTVDLWARVLQAVSGSRLLIAVASEARTQQRLRSQFEARGIGAERLTFRAKTSHAEFLALFNEVDIALDTIPYTGSTTTSHALWMGVPVLTLEGSVPQQDQSATILRSMGMHEWVAVTEEGFVDMAKVAAEDVKALSDLRLRLRPMAAERFEQSRSRSVDEISQALQFIWGRWCAGVAPDSFSVTR